MFNDVPALPALPAHMLPALHAARGYAHVVVAPHLDDAVLSCGGQIALLTQSGVRVLAVTLCAGRPPHAAELSPFAQYLHREWALGADPIGRRREEDAQALALLDCDGLHLDQLDAPYRVADYGVGDGWRGTVAADDPLIAAADAILTQLWAQQPEARFYVPLGVGNHVDHQVMCAAGLKLAHRGAAVVWYEDAPYAAKEPAAVSERLQQLAVPLVPHVVDIGAVLERKLRAIAVYQSQLHELFGTVPMEQMMIEYAAAVAGMEGGYGERVWRLPMVEGHAQT